MHTSTHTHSIMRVSPATFAEIKGKLEAAGYHDQIDETNLRGQPATLIKMYGIALQADPTLDPGATPDAGIHPR